jgi:hypothetical protein
LIKKLPKEGARRSKKPARLIHHLNIVKISAEINKTKFIKYWGEAIG